MSVFIKGNEEGDEEFTERRTFPRIVANCPVLYRIQPNDRWQVARLEEFSATGFSMVCDENLPDGIGISLQIKPGSAKTVPKLSAEGQVTRCKTNKEQHFMVSGKILKILRNP